MEWHFRYLQIKENIRIKRSISKDTRFLDFIWHIGVFAIGYSYLPSVYLASLLKETSIWHRELEKFKILRDRKLEDMQDSREVMRKKFLGRSKKVLEFVVEIEGRSYLRQAGDL